MPFYFRYVDDTLLCVHLEKLQTVIDTFNYYHPRIQFTHEMERKNRISFLEMEIIKLDNGKIVSNWYRKSTYSGRVLNFILNHPFQNKVAIIKNLVDRVVYLSRESFQSENLNFVRKILFFYHYPQDSIEKHIKISIRQSKRCKVTYMGQTGRLLNTRVEHKNNLGRKCNYHNVLSDRRKEYADHDFDSNNVEISHSESSKAKREFMEMLYIKREETYSINLKTDLVKYNGCYGRMISYL